MLASDLTLYHTTNPKKKGTKETSTLKPWDGQNIPAIRWAQNNGEYVQ